jgi:ribonuclease D
LIAGLLGVHLEKGQTRSDWMRRPLSEAQLIYAADDVRHLRQAFELLDAKLNALGRREWLDQDCERQLDAAETDATDVQPHLALRPAQKMRPAAQARLRLLLMWREQQARQSDKPKSWILDNNLILELAQSTPRDRTALDALLDARPRAPRRSRDDLWQTLAREMTSEELDIPLAQQPDPAQREMLRRMQQEVASAAAELELPEGLLCSRRNLEALIAAGEWPDALRGWRQPLLEERLGRLLKHG